MEPSEEQEEELDRDDKGRFAPGNKGGPGRPKGSTGPSLKAALLRAIENAPPSADGKTIADGLATVCLRNALAGDYRYMAMLWDRLDGPVKQEQTVDQTIVIERVARRIPDGDRDVDQDLSSDSH